MLKQHSSKVTLEEAHSFHAHTVSTTRYSITIVAQCSGYNDTYQFVSVRNVALQRRPQSEERVYMSFAGGGIKFHVFSGIESVLPPIGLCPSVNETAHLVGLHKSNAEIVADSFADKQEPWAGTVVMPERPYFTIQGVFMMRITLERHPCGTQHLQSAHRGDRCACRSLDHRPEFPSVNHCVAILAETKDVSRVSDPFLQ